MAIDNQQVHQFLQNAEATLYNQWKRYGGHLEEYASEFVGTAFHIFAVVAVVGIMFAPSSPMGRLLPDIHLRLLCAGLLIGSSGWLVALSPFGRLSGGHINPAISLGFWTLGRMHGRDLIGYVIGQMLGGAVGVLAASAILPSLAHQVRFAVLAPAPGLTSWATFGLEVLATFALATVIFSFVASKRLMRYTPAAVTVTAGILVCLDGALSGAGLNPARWFGPAIFLSQWHLGWAYVAGPVLGTLIAAGIRLHPELIGHMPNTCKLFHDARYRSIFKHETVPTTPPPEVRNAVEP
jgi:aquaporin Z